MLTGKDEVLPKHACQTVADRLGRDAEQNVKAPAVVLLVEAPLGHDDIGRVRDAARHIHCKLFSKGARCRAAVVRGKAYPSP